MKTQFTQGTERIFMDSFDSLGEMIRYAETNPEFGSSDKNGRDFTMTDSFAQAATLARHGWHDVRPNVERLMNSLTEKIGERIDFAQIANYSVSGSIVDMGRYMTGEPECMLEFATEPCERMGRVVRIFVDYGANAGHSVDHFLKRGSALLALIDSLTKLGVSCEVYGETSVTGSRDKIHTTVVKLHDARDPMDVDALMFTLAHPSMLRRLTFAVREMSDCHKAIGAYSGGSYGSSTKMRFARQQQPDVCMERTEHGAGLMMSDPVEWVCQTITGLGLL